MKKVFNSKEYWENRYKIGGNSGNGSYGKLNEFKSEVINELITEFNIKSMLELGCGDGNQLKGFKVDKYVGVDVSKTIIDECIKNFSGDDTKEFYHETDFDPIIYDATISLDVIYHLVEDDVYNKYISDLFTLSKDIVILYTFSDSALGLALSEHLKHRPIKDLTIPNDWKMIREINNKYPVKNGEGSHSNFYIFKKIHK